MAIREMAARSPGSESRLPAPILSLAKQLRRVSPFDWFFLAVLIVLWSVG